MYYVVSVNVFTIYLQTWASSHLSVEFCIVQVVHSNNFVTNFLIIKKEIPCLIWEGKWWSFFFTTKTNLHIGKTSVIQVSIKPSNTEVFSLGYMDFVGIKQSPELDLIIEDYFLIWINIPFFTGELSQELKIRPTLFHEIPSRKLQLCFILTWSHSWRSSFVFLLEVNPPYFVPLVEIVPHPETDPSTIERTYALMKKIGQSPVKLNREIEGFVLNRLQYAVISEAWRLVGVRIYFSNFYTLPVL